MPLLLKVENTYECGRESETNPIVESPPVPLLITGETDDQDTEWWYDQVYGNTGDGHPCGSSDDATYDVTVIESNDRPDLVGMRWLILP